MATRFYFPASGAAAVSPAISAVDWAHINVLRRPLNAVNGGSAIATTTYSPDAADHLVAGRAHVAQFVSDVLPPQTIAAQLVKLQVRAAETIATNNLFLNWKIYAVTEDGQSVLGTLLAVRADGTEVGTVLTNRADSATTSAFSSVVNFRLVVEIGLGGTPTASASVDGHNGSMSFGENAATDLPEDDASTAALNPWVQFSQNLELKQGKSVSYEFVRRCAGGAHTTFNVTFGGGVSQEITYDTDQLSAPLSDMTSDEKQKLTEYLLRTHFAGTTRQQKIDELNAGPVTVTI